MGQSDGAAERSAHVERGSQVHDLAPGIPHDTVVTYTMPDGTAVVRSWQARLPDRPVAVSAVAVVVEVRR